MTSARWDVVGNADLVGSLVAAFQRFQEHNARVTSTFVTRFGVGVQELHALMALNVQGPLPLKALGEMTRLRSSTATYVVDRLAVAGYVQRSPHPVDRRSNLVAVTDDGAAVVTHMYSFYEALFGQSLTGTQIRHMTQVLESVNATLEKAEAA
jgi:DNA-binding MarR family transcriptional regulator